MRKNTAVLRRPGRMRLVRTQRPEKVSVSGLQVIWVSQVHVVGSMDSAIGSVVAGCLQLAEAQCPCVGLVVAGVFEGLWGSFGSAMVVVSLAWVKRRTSRAAAG